MTHDLFGRGDALLSPLADRMRPAVLEDYAGQSHLLAEGRPLRRAIESDRLHSMIFWGPPGVGKTTLARLIANVTSSRFETLSAVMAGVKDIREKIEQADLYRYQGVRTILFIDEVHRFNKSQQDAFLPYVENGTILFIGATTENPSFELNSALLSRARVYTLKPLADPDILSLLQRALNTDEELQQAGISVAPDALELVASVADGDGRRALTLLEMLADSAAEGEQISLAQVQEIAGRADSRRFDKKGDVFYEQISALHKAVRGSSPDAALYWCCRMLDGGCDPLYIARRVVRMASEDIGNADPRALTLALNAWEVQQRLGSPEGELTIAQAVIYLACAPKSNAVYNAFNQMRALVASGGSEDVPMHLRNAPTELMQELGMGEEYRYAHDEPGAYAAGESYFPESLQDLRVYHPADRGLEGKIREKLDYLRQLDESSLRKRYK